MWIHLTARATHVRPLADREAATWTWHALRARWPDALAACLMPDHVHLVLSSSRPHADRQSLSRLLGAFSRNVDPAGWSIAPTELIKTAEHARRTLRYVHLNPCRGRLTDDPLAWRWSTHRGAIGAEVDPWVSAARLAVALGGPPSGFAQHLHRVVSGDPSASPVGTPFPRPAPCRASPEVPIGAVVAAAAAATPWSSAPAFRRAAALLARHQGWSGSLALARELGVSPRTVLRHASQHDAELLAAAALCLGDERLRRHGFRDAAAAHPALPP